MIHECSRLSKATIWLIYLFLGFAAMFALSSVQAASDKDRPALVIPSPNYDAGTAREGDKITHTFTVKNDGKAELRIMQVKPG